MDLELIVLYCLSTSNHNFVYICNVILKIVLYRLSTSNHNVNLSSAKVRKIVLYRLSTSNHNYQRQRLSDFKLSYIVFLHQTTTPGLSLIHSGRLSYIVFLHQTTTLRWYCWFRRRLSYIVFLHQTTTNVISFKPIEYCLISSFYIKPQPIGSLLNGMWYCLISSFYIKPQLFADELQNAAQLSYIVFLHQTTTNGHLYNLALRIVLYRLSTSNHNSLSITP